MKIKNLESVAGIHTHIHTGNLRNKKGITLVALVVTIIILLILAGISIASLTENGLFEKAKLAEQKSKEAQENEITKLDEYTNKIEEVIGDRDLKSQTSGTATPEDIIEGKTAWVNGEKIIGTMKKECYKLLSWSASVGTGHGITDYTTTILDTIENNKSIEVVCSGNVGTWVTYYLIINENVVDTITDGNLHTYSLESYPYNADVKIRMTTNATFVGAGYAVKINE